MSNDEILILITNIYFDIILSHSAFQRCLHCQDGSMHDIRFNRYNQRKEQCVSRNVSPLTRSQTDSQMDHIDKEMVSLHYNIHTDK